MARRRSLGSRRALRPEISKKKDGRVLPLSGDLLEIIERAAAERRLDCRFVFHRDGEAVGDFRKAWRNACTAAGVRPILVHDLRRTAVRNMVRAGIPDRIAMTQSGHKTRSVFDRYNIVSESDLAQATRQLQSHHRREPPSRLPSSSNSNSKARFRSVEPTIQNGITRPNKAATDEPTSICVSEVAD